MASTGLSCTCINNPNLKAFPVQSMDHGSSGQKRMSFCFLNAHQIQITTKVIFVESTKGFQIQLHVFNSTAAKLLFYIGICHKENKLC